MKTTVASWRMQRDRRDTYILFLFLNEEHSVNIGPFVPNISPFYHLNMTMIFDNDDTLINIYLLGDSNSPEFFAPILYLPFYRGGCIIR